MNDAMQDLLATNFANDNHMSLVRTDLCHIVIPICHNVVMRPVLWFQHLQQELVGVCWEECHDSKENRTNTPNICSWTTISTTTIIRAMTWTKHTPSQNAHALPQANTHTHTHTHWYAQSLTHCLRVCLRACLDIVNCALQQHSNWGTTLNMYLSLVYSYCRSRVCIHSDVGQWVPMWQMGAKGSNGDKWVSHVHVQTRTNLLRTNIHQEDRGSYTSFAKASKVEETTMHVRVHSTYTKLVQMLNQK